MFHNSLQENEVLDIVVPLIINIMVVKIVVTEQLSFYLDPSHMIAAFSAVLSSPGPQHTNIPTLEHMKVDRPLHSADSRIPGQVFLSNKEVSTPAGGVDQEVY